MADGCYKSTAVSAQCGAAVLLRRLHERQLINLTDPDKLQQLKQLYSLVEYKPNVFIAEAMQFQQLCTALGYPLRPAGRAGQLTSNVSKKTAGEISA